jgi:hypothetical protein
MSFQALIAVSAEYHHVNGYPVTWTKPCDTAANFCDNTGYFMPEESRQLQRGVGRCPLAPLVYLRLANAYSAVADLEQYVIAIRHFRFFNIKERKARLRLFLH